MPNYAIYDDDIILNVIVAESKELAESVSGKNALETDGSPWIEWTKINGSWAPPKPYNSWTWDGAEWVAPIRYPEDGNEYEWNEDEQNWLIVEEEVEDNANII